MGPLICTSFQQHSQARHTWVGTDVEDVERNILTGDKHCLDNVWTFYCNISILKEIVFIFVVDIWKWLKVDFLYFLCTEICKFF